jgi:hypothetical protein
MNTHCSFLEPPAGIIDEDNHGPRKIENPFHFGTFDWPRGLNFISSPSNLQILYSFEHSLLLSLHSLAKCISEPECYVMING